MVEAALSTVIVAVMLVAALQTASASNLAQAKAAERAVGRFLADGLMADLSQFPYADPTGGTIVGIDLGEVLGQRAGYDDVDDFDGWAESPPQDRDGAALAGLSGWQRTVKVEAVNRTTLAVSLVETGAKRVTVTVKHNGAVICTRVAIRTSAP